MKSRSKPSFQVVNSNSRKMHILKNVKINEITKVIESYMLNIRKKLMLYKWRKLASEDFIYTKSKQLIKYCYKILNRSEPHCRTEPEVKCLIKWILLTETRRANNNIFSYLNHEDLEKVSQELILKTYSPNELIFVHHERAQLMYLILSGTVDIFEVNFNKIDLKLRNTFIEHNLVHAQKRIRKFGITDPDHPSLVLGECIRNHHLLNTLESGDVLGEIAFTYENGIYTAAALSNKKTELVSLSKSFFETVIKPYLSTKMQYNTVLKFLKTLDLFSDWKDGQLENLAFWFKLHSYPRQTTVVRRDSMITSFTIVMDGVVKLLSYGKNGVVLDLCLISSGSIMGEESLFELNKKSEYQAVSVTNVQILSMTEQNQKKFLKYSTVYSLNNNEIGDANY